MLRKTVSNAFLIFILVLAITNFLVAYSTVSVGTFGLYVIEDSSIGVQGSSNYIILEVTSGYINTTNTALSISTDNGYLSFTPNNTGTFKLYFDYDRVEVSGDQNTSSRVVQTSSSFTFNAGNNIKIRWINLITPYLPIMFIFGMIGLVSMFFGGLNFVDQMQKKNYYKAFITSTIAIAIGIAFVLAWLWT